MTKAIEEKSKKPRNGQYQPGDEYIDEMLKESGISREAIFGAELRCQIWRYVRIALHSSALLNTKLPASYSPVILGRWY